MSRGSQQQFGSYPGLALDLLLSDIKKPSFMYKLIFLMIKSQLKPKAWCLHKYYAAAVVLFISLPPALM